MSPTTRAVYTVDEVAEQLGIGRTTAYDAINRGEIPHVRVGRRIVVPKEQFEVFLGSGWTPEVIHEVARTESAALPGRARRTSGRPEVNGGESMP